MQEAWREVPVRVCLPKNLHHSGRVPGHNRRIEAWLESIAADFIPIDDIRMQSHTEPIPLPVKVVRDRRAMAQQILGKSSAELDALTSPAGNPTLFSTTACPDSYFATMQAKK